MKKIKTTTDEFSFVLNVSPIHGIGVFATHGILKGTKLELFWERGRSLQKVPRTFLKYCIKDGKQYACANNFGRMSVGWYLNHSKTPNAFHKKYIYFAERNIRAGEEILIDYDTL
jgi:SET domain-containing protein